MYRTIENQDVATIPTHTLSGMLGYVPEDICFVPGTIGANIARMEKSFDLEKVVLAARHAQAHDMIESLPKAYLTQLDEAGSQLSKGERQLVALARALYCSPKILIVDEPGSIYSDVLGENIFERLDAYKSEQNIVIIFSRNAFHFPVTDRTYVIEENQLKLVKHGISGTQGFPETAIPKIVAG